MNYPKKVTIGDITVRDGFQHEEKFIPTEAKLWVAEQLILSGFKHIEVTNFGNPRGMPQFSDSDDLMKAIYKSKKVKNMLNDVSLTCVTIRERAIERAIEAKKEGWGPDRILLMVSTSESHHIKNSGLSLADYWKMSEEWIKKANDVGIKVNGTVSTIWGCPIEGPTEMSKALEFAQRWLDIGASDVEHADHDGSASPDRVYKYYSMLLDKFQKPNKHIVHKDPNIVGLVSTEDMVVMMDEMGIETNLDIDKILETGRMVERIVERPLRSESIKNGRIPKNLSGR